MSHSWWAGSLLGPSGVQGGVDLAFFPTPHALVPCEAEDPMFRALCLWDMVNPCKLHDLQFGISKSSNHRRLMRREGSWRREPGALRSSPHSVADLLVTLGKSPSLFAPQFPHLKHGIKVLFGTKILSFWSHLESSWPYFRQVVLKLLVLEPFSTLKDVQGPQRAFEFMWVN